jgi:Omp85 superfamily domain/Surface antigen variable number repeat
MNRSCVQAARALLLVIAVCMPARTAGAESSQGVLERLVLEGATVYSREDVLWLLDLREGASISKSATEIAAALQDRYARDGYTEARVEGRLDGGQLTLHVDEGRIDDIELLGVDAAQASRLRLRLGVKPGDIYNKRTIGQAIDRLMETTQGALMIGRPRSQQPGAHHEPDTPEDVVLERKGSRNVLIIPLRWRRSRVGVEFGTGGREDLFSPVDGFAPALGATATIFDHNRFNHTLIDGYASYKFGREDAGYALGMERPLFAAPKLFFGAEIHDITASDDLWRLSTAEQTLVALGFRNTFRDYYRRRGAQIFGVLQAGENNEFTLMTRWDRHEPLANSTDFNLFRGDEPFRLNPPVNDQDVNAWLIGYTFDTRPLTGPGEVRTYQRHLHESLFGFGLRQQPGLRLEWTSELAGHGLGGDARFDRHILNLRGYLAFSDRQLLAMRGIVGGSNGDLPIERRFALGGIGTVHGYRFKEESGTGMTLVNAEYRVRLAGRGREDSAFSVFGFYDAGHVTGPLNGSTGDWLQGIGFGFGIPGLRLEFGYRAKDIPSSLQVLVRLGPTF